MEPFGHTLSWGVAFPPPNRRREPDAFQAGRRKRGPLLDREVEPSNLWPNPLAAGDTAIGPGAGAQVNQGALAAGVGPRRRRG
jgi:hypothetical protein